MIGLFIWSDSQPHRYDNQTLNHIYSARVDMIISFSTTSTRIYTYDWTVDSTTSTVYTNIYIWLNSRFNHQAVCFLQRTSKYCEFFWAGFNNYSTICHRQSLSSHLKWIRKPRSQGHKSKRGCNVLDERNRVMITNLKLSYRSR